MALFKKDKPEESSEFKRDSRKARRFFEHAQAVADTRNYDYSIECYINGLRHEPGNLEKHEALREVALRRKVAGGKPEGLFQSLKGGGKTFVDKMLHAEMLWAKDPLNAQHALGVMEYGVEVQRADPEINMGPWVQKVGSLLIEAGQTSKKPTRAMFIKARDCLAAVKAFDLAVTACRLALQFSPEDPNLLQDLKNLEAERIMAKSGYEKAVQKEEGGALDVVKDLDKQRQLDLEDRIVKTDSVVDEILQRRRTEYEESPEDQARLSRLIDALLQKNTDEAENEAAKLLRDAWEQTGQYRFKLRIGDITMRQMNRHLRQIKVQIDANHSDEQAKKQYQELSRKKLQFELEEYTERVKNYPTDMGLRFELGKRLYLVKKFDEAIALFQEAQADAKHRITSLEYLGMCYLAKGWWDEAVQTLRRGVEDYPTTNDRLALDMRYLLMDALENSARKSNSLEQAREAQQLASNIVQININFRDIRGRLEKLRALADELGK